MLAAALILTVIWTGGLAWLLWSLIRAIIGRD